MRGEIIRPLHGLRGIAALSVVYAHSAVYVKQPGPTFAGSMGVALFFALSGFLMAHLYLRKPATYSEIWQYVVARFARIYPLFAVLLVGSFFAYALFDSFPFRMSGTKLIEHLLLAGDGRTIWTISTEFQFYAMFVAFWLLYHIPSKHNDVWLAVLLLAIVVALATVGYSSSRASIFGYLHIFIFGMLSALALNREVPNWIGRTAGICLPLLFAGWVFAGFIADSVWGQRWTYHVTWLMALTGGLVFCAVAAERSFFGRILGSRPMIFLGEISFGIYLFHNPLIWFLWGTVPVLHEMHWSVRATVLLVLLIAGAAIAHMLIERPSRTWIRERLPAPDQIFKQHTSTS